MPVLQLSDHVRTRHQIQITTHRWLRQTERCRRLGSVPDLAVVVSKHGPEAVELWTWNANAQLRQLLFEEGTYELLAPREAARFGACGKRSWKPAAQPKASVMF